MVSLGCHAGQSPQVKPAVGLSFSKILASAQAASTRQLREAAPRSSSTQSRFRVASSFCPMSDFRVVPPRSWQKQEYDGRLSNRDVGIHFLRPGGRAGLPLGYGLRWHCLSSWFCLCFAFKWIRPLPGIKGWYQWNVHWAQVLVNLCILCLWIHIMLLNCIIWGQSYWTVTTMWTSQW